MHRARSFSATGPPLVLNIGLKRFRDRFNIHIGDDSIGDAPFYKSAEDSPEIRYLKRRREELGGFLLGSGTILRKVIAAARLLE